MVSFSLEGGEVASYLTLFCLCGQGFVELLVRTVIGYIECILLFVRRSWTNAVL